MNLPFIKHQNPPEKREYFFVVEIGLGSVQVALWSVVNAKPQILAVGNSVAWKSDNVESLIQSVDQSLGMACEKGGLTSENQPTKMILGLPADWVALDKVAQAKLTWLRLLSDKLELKPVGFVTEHEAIIRFIQQNEGVPVTSVLLLVWPDYLETTLVRLGKVVGTVLVRKSQNLTDDVVEGLARLQRIEVLPSRIFLTGSGVDMEQARQLLLNYPWTTPSKKFSFLHFPKIEILPSDFGAKAIASSVSLEMAELFEEEAVSEPLISTAADFGFTESDVVSRSVEPPIQEDHWVNKPEVPSANKPNLSFIFVGIILFLLVGGGISAFYWFVPKAAVTIRILPKSISQSFDLVLNAKANSIEVEVKGDQSLPTTGNKLVGDKATGTVIVESGLDTERKFSAGTILTSASGIKFSLDNDILVASASGSVGNLILGKTNAKVTAVSVGSDYNLSAGTIFRVGVLALTQVDARNEIAFSGGSSRQVKSVAKEDILNLRTTLAEKLKNEAKTKLSSKVGTGNELIAESMTVLVVSEDFDHKLDEAADSVKLSLSVKARAFVYKKSELEEIITTKISSLVPEGYTSQQELDKVFKIKHIDKEGAKLSVKITAIMWPQINISDFSKLYAGKKNELVISDLKKEVGVESVTINAKPGLPLINDRLPFWQKNIEFKVVSQ